MKKLLAVKLLALALVCITACASSGCFGFGLAGLLFDKDKKEVVQKVEDDYDVDADSDFDDVVAPELNDSGEVVLTKKDKNVKLLDTENYSVLVEEVTTDSDYDLLVLDTKTENKSVSEEYTFSIENTVINGMVGSGSYYENLEPGDRSTSDMSFYFSGMPASVQEENMKATMVTFTLKVMDSDYNYVDTLDVAVYPEGENKAEFYERKSLKTDQVIYNENNVKITYIGMEEVYGSGEAFFFVENMSNQSVSVNFEDVEINGQNSDCYFYATLPVDACYYSYIYFSEDTIEDLELKSYKDIKTIEVELNLYNSETYDTIDNVDLPAIKVN